MLLEGAPQMTFFFLKYEIQAEDGVSKTFSLWHIIIIDLCKAPFCLV